MLVVANVFLMLVFLLLFFQKKKWGSVRTNREAVCERGKVPRINSNALAPSKILSDS